MTNSRKFKVAVIGLGWWGQTIVRYLKNARNIDCVLATDLNQEAGKAFAQSQGVEFSPSFEATIQDPRIEGVVLCTPHSMHADQMVQVAAAGKHIFCEKPLCLNRADVLRAMEMIHSGMIGTPLQMEANFSQDKFLQMASDNWRLNSAEAPAGPMTATGIHLLDLSVGVFGPAETVFASVKQLGSPLVNGDTLAILATYKRGGHALISAILATPFVGRFAVFGSKGWVEVRDKTHPEASTGWTMNWHIRGEEVQTASYEPHPAVLSNLEAFADAAMGGKPYPVPQEQMLANISALEAVVKSTRSGKVEQVEG